MTNRQFQRKTRKMVLKRYNFILDNTKANMKVYGLTRIPLKFLNETIDKAKYSKTELQIPELIAHTKNFNKTLETIKGFAKDNEKFVGDGAISYFELKQWIDRLKAVFIEAQNKEEEPKK